MATAYQYTKFAGCSQIPVLNATLVESPTPGTGNETKTPQTPGNSKPCSFSCCYFVELMFSVPGLVLVLLFMLMLMFVFSVFRLLSV